MEPQRVYRQVQTNGHMFSDQFGILWNIRHIPDVDIQRQTPEIQDIMLEQLKKLATGGLASVPVDFAD